MEVDANTVSGILDEIGKRLSGPAGHTYEILVKQAYISGYMDLTAGIGLTILLFSFGYATYRMFKNDFFRKHDDFATIWSILGCLAIILLPLLIICSLCTGIGELLNPEYYAIMDIVGKISGN